MPTSAAAHFCFFYFSSAPSLYNILISFFHERDKLVFTDWVRIFLELIALSGQVWVGFTREGPIFQGHEGTRREFILQNGAVNK